MYADAHIHAQKGKAVDAQFVYFIQRWSLINTVLLTINHLPKKYN